MTGTQAPRRAARPQRGGRRAVRRRRRSSRRPLILLLAIVLVAGVLVPSSSRRTAGRPPAAAAARRPPPRSPRSPPRWLPHIAQTGVRPASADRATGLVQVQATTKKAGADVTLQVRRGQDLGRPDHAAAGQGRAGDLRDAERPDRRRSAAAGRREHGPRRCTPTRSPRRLEGRLRRPVRRHPLDTTKWSYRQLGLLNPGRTKAESSADAVRVENGALKLGMLENPARPGYYLNGHISTEQSFTFTYGVAAARVKFQKPRGMHGAFWLQAPSFGAVPGDAKQSGSEIDAVEYFGSTYPDGGLASFTYYRDKDGNSAKTGGLQTGRDRRAGARGRVVEEVPRVLRRVDAGRVRHPHRRPGDLPADQEHLRGAGVHGAQPAVLGLGAPRPRQDADPHGHEGRLGARLPAAAASSSSRSPGRRRSLRAAPTVGPAGPAAAYRSSHGTQQTAAAGAAAMARTSGPGTPGARKWTYRTSHPVRRAGRPSRRTGAPSGRGLDRPAVRDSWGGCDGREMARSGRPELAQMRQTDRPPQAEAPTRPRRAVRHARPSRLKRP